MTVLIGTILAGLAGLTIAGQAARGPREDHAPIPVRVRDPRR
ncbi:hypothetical protein [Salipiger sp. IMCC34102]|nr:hypothetical protein [Salipiger sp. IMCC34102]